MSVMSESTIRTHIANGTLLKNADISLVCGSSYSCRASRLYPGGIDKQGQTPSFIDWTTAASASFFRIEPRGLIWVRIREIVQLPSDVCAFWWQTNSLSRKGLMLVNMSMVDPGYEGPLACLFVNFGREPIDIDPEMSVARLVFHELDRAAIPFPKGQTISEYDRTVRSVALQGSSIPSFKLCSPLVW